jgi:pimeloyl-ACP methyl ester carboxylesterase
LFIDNAVLRSEDGRNAIARAEYNLANHYRNVLSINPAGNFRVEETEPGDDVLLLLHGFGTGEGVWGTLDDRNSPLSVACEVFEGRVLIANYPSTESVGAIAAGLITELAKIEMICGGTIPRLAVFAHSLGGEVARSMVRIKPERFGEVALVSSPNTGLHFGIMTGYVFKYYYKYYEALMLRHGMVPREGGGGHAQYGGRSGFHSAIDDLHPKGGFIEGINSRHGTPGDPLDVTYHFFIFQRSGANNIFIPGRDDSLVSPGSAYPYARIRRGEIENVGFGTVMRFRGDVNHYTLIYNPDIVRAILRALKAGTDPRASTVPKKHGEVVRVRVPRAPACEIEQRKKIEQIAL